jgi:hypothetical protein
MYCGAYHKTIMAMPPLLTKNCLAQDVLDRVLAKEMSITLNFPSVLSETAAIFASRTNNSLAEGTRSLPRFHFPRHLQQLQPRLLHNALSLLHRVVHSLANAPSAQGRER